MPRIALIHATRLAIQPIEDGFRNTWPEAELVHLLDESLSIDMASGHVSEEALYMRIVQLAYYAQGANPSAILFTCSAFGPGIEQAATQATIPVLKPNEAMFEAAVKEGGHLCLLYTFPQSVGSMLSEFESMTKHLGLEATLTPIYVEDAREHLSSGDQESHDQRIVETVKARASEFDGFLLAHFSMASALTVLKTQSSRLCWSPVDSAVIQLKRLFLN